MIQTKKSNTIFLKFVFSYLLISLIPLCAGIIVYHRTLNLVEDDTIQSNLNILEQCQNVLDSRLAETDQMVKRLVLDDNILNFLNEESPFIDKKNVFKIYELQDQISAFKDYNNFIESLYLYFKKSSVFVSRNESFIRTPFFYGHTLEYDNMTYDEWLKDILNKCHRKEFLPAVPVKIDNKQENMITYIQSLPIDTNTNPKGAIILFICEQKIHDYLNRINIADTGWSYIQDEKGQVLTTYGAKGNDFSDLSSEFENQRGCFNRNINGHNMLVLYSKSSYNGWNYVSVIPKKVILSKIIYIKTIIFTSFMVAMLLGVFVAIALAYRNSKPINEVITTLKKMMTIESTKSNNGYEFLQGSVVDLINKNTLLQKKIEEQDPIVKASFMERLFSGEISSMNEINEYIVHYNLKYIKGKSLALIIKIIISKTNNIMQMNAVKILIKEKIKNIFGNWFFSDVDKDKIVLLIDLNEVANYEEYVINIVDKIKQGLDKNYNIKLLFSIGNQIDNITNINRSVVQAYEALEYKNIPSDKIVLWYKNIPKQGNVYFYPLDVERHLMNMTKSGNLHSVTERINDIFKENFIERKLSIEMVNHLMNDMISTTIKLKSQLIENNIEYDNSIEKNIGEIKECLSGREMFDKFILIYTVLVDYVNENKKSHNITLRNNIKQYIKSNYTDSNLCLTSLADNFNMTKPYLSQFFKDQEGINFSEYLEKLRITEANQLLLATNLTVSEISEKVGYNSSAVFRKAFKRVNGVTPSQYKKDNKR